MAQDMWTLINRELAKLEKAKAGAPDTSYAGVFKEAMEYGTQQREWNERKNLQRQKMMALGTEGWEESTNIDSLASQSDWLNKFRARNSSNMDDITLEYSDLLQSQINNRSKRIVKLHTDVDMLEQSKEQWLGIADSLVGRQLGHEDYNDLSVGIDQYVQFKGDMLTSNADFLALPQFQHIKQDMIGQDLIIKEIMTEAKDANIFSPYEHEWTTRALEEGNYAIIQEERLKRAQDRERDVGDLGGIIDKKMDLYRRVQEIAGGGSALLPEITRDATSLYSLQDLGFDKTEEGDYVPSEGKWGGGEEEELLRSEWNELAGSMSPTISGDILGVAESGLKEVDALYETKFGNKYTFGKYGFEDLYPDPDKPSRTPGSDPDVDFSEEVTDADGYIDIDKAVDDFGWGEAGAITTAVGVANYKKVHKGYLSAKKFMGEVANLSDDKIAAMLVDSDVEKFVKQLNDKGKQLKKVDRVKNPNQYQALLKARKKIIDEAYDVLGVRFATDQVTALDDATNSLKLAQKGGDAAEVGKAKAAVNSAREAVETHKKGMLKLIQNTNKWDLWKMKGGMGVRQAGRTVKDLAKIGGKTFGKLTPLDMAVWGWMLGDKAGLNNYYKGAISAVGYYSAKQVMNMVSRKGGVMKAMMNPTLQSKIGKYLIAKAPGLATKMGIKAVAGTAAQVVPFLGQLFGGAMLAWTAKDLYNLISDVPELTQYVMEWARGEYDEEKEFPATPEVLPKF